MATNFPAIKIYLAGNRFEESKNTAKQVKIFTFAHLTIDFE